MKLRKCPYCGSTRITRSPSGEHMLCLGCQRILVVTKTKETKGNGHSEEAETESHAEPEPRVEG